MLLNVKDTHYFFRKNIESLFLLCGNIPHFTKKGHSKFSLFIKGLIFATDSLNKE